MNSGITDFVMIHQMTFLYLERVTHFKYIFKLLYYIDKSA